MANSTTIRDLLEVPLMAPGSKTRSLEECSICQESAKKATFPTTVTTRVCWLSLLSLYAIATMKLGHQTGRLGSGSRRMTSFFTTHVILRPLIGWTKIIGFLWSKSRFRQSQKRSHRITICFLITHLHCEISVGPLGTIPLLPYMSYRIIWESSYSSTFFWWIRSIHDFPWEKRRSAPTKISPRPRSTQTPFVEEKPMPPLEIWGLSPWWQPGDLIFFQHFVCNLHFSL